MNLLILGGTVFLGKHLVRSALNKGHSVTLFNRGKHNPELFPDVEKLRGDRSGDFKSLDGKSFDAVIDTSGYIPRTTRLSAETLKDKAGHYTFISSISVYKDFSDMNLNEDSETSRLEDESVEEITGETYGALKYLSEREVQNVFRENTLIIRPGLIVGEDDPSDRFTYWIHRINKGGKVLAPGNKHKKVQFIDVKDLADWIIKMAEENKSGVYNATGPDYDLTFDKLLEECKAVTGNDAAVEWVDEKFLIEENVGAYVELPLWLPEDSEGGNNVQISKATQAGLKFRSLKETLNDTLRFDKTREDYKLKAGLSPEREKQLLRKWKEEQ